MPIVADTTVFRYLVVLEVAEILPALLEHVLTSGTPGALTMALALVSVSDAIPH
jgi:hypothetical protein